jgi:hypothetical protein
MYVKHEHVQHQAFAFQGLIHHITFVQVTDVGMLAPCHPERSACHPERSACHPERSEGSPVSTHTSSGHGEILRCAQDDRPGYQPLYL